MVKREHTNADLDAAKRRCERLGRRLVRGSRTVMYQQRSSEAFAICSVNALDRLDRGTAQEC